MDATRKGKTPVIIRFDITEENAWLPSSLSKDTHPLAIQPDTEFRIPLDDFLNKNQGPHGILDENGESVIVLGWKAMAKFGIGLQKRDDQFFVSFEKSRLDHYKVL